MIDVPPERPPRWATPRDPSRSTLGEVFDELASVLGVMLFAWQRLAADVVLEVDPRTRALRYRTVGVSVARQNGKTLLVIIRIALELVRPRLDRRLHRPGPQHGPPPVGEALRLGCTCARRSPAEAA